MKLKITIFFSLGLFFLVGCLPSGNILSEQTVAGLQGSEKSKGGTDDNNGLEGDGPDSGGTSDGNSSGGGSGGNGGGGVDGVGKAPGCTGTPGVICSGGYGSDSSKKSLKAKVVYGNPAGARLTSDPLKHATDFINLVNSNYTHQNHRFMNLELDPAKVIEVTQESDSVMINKYAEDGYVTLILVDNIPGPTAGYVQNMCAELQKKQAWTVFEFPLVAKGVVEHEINHLFCFPHTSSQNGSTPNMFLPGYNTMKDILSAVQSYKKPFSPPFKLYIDQQNRSGASVTHDNMVYFTGNLMYYSVLPQKPKLFTTHGEGYPHSYSHLLDYYYWNFIKPFAK